MRASEEWKCSSCSSGHTKLTMGDRTFCIFSGNISSVTYCSTWALCMWNSAIFIHFRRWLQLAWTIMFSKDPTHWHFFVSSNILSSISRRSVGLCECVWVLHASVFLLLKAEIMMSAFKKSSGDTKAGKSELNPENLLIIPQSCLKTQKICVLDRKGLKTFLCN